MSDGIPDGDRIVADHLRDAEGLRVVSTSPTDKTESWVRLNLINAVSVGPSRADHLFNFFMQADCYAGEDVAGEVHGLPEARALAKVVRAALVAMPDLDFDDAVVTAVPPRQCMSRHLPDTDGFEPARERYIVEAQVYMHSKEPGS